MAAAPRARGSGAVATGPFAGTASPAREMLRGSRGFGKPSECAAREARMEWLPAPNAGPHAARCTRSCAPAGDRPCWAD